MSYQQREDVMVNLPKLQQCQCSQVKETGVKI